MTDFYQLIADRQELQKFIDWLPETKDSEQYYMSLFGRKKYLPDHPALKSDKTMLSRWTTVKERMINKIEQKETKVGTYLGHNDLAVPQEALAVYMTPSPRDFRRVGFETIKTFADKLGKGEYLNPRQEVMNLIQNTAVKNRFHVFDIDQKDPAILAKVESFVGDLYNAIETRGGYHIIINPQDLENEVVDKNWYKGIAQMADVRGDALVPVPGCYQGMFIPKLIKISRKH
jgi:hypothetical protein